MVSLNNIFHLLNGYSYENYLVRKKFLKFQSNEINPDGKFPSLVTRYGTFLAMRRQAKVDFIPHMMNVAVTFVIGANIMHSVETKYAIADNHQLVNDTLRWNIVAKMPMETTIVFKVQLYSKEGEGVTCGVGALKLFDENGFMVQGEQEVQLYTKEKMELFKIGCIDKHYSTNEQIAKVGVRLPRFKSSMMWTLTDPGCAKLMGYHPQMQVVAAK